MDFQQAERWYVQTFSKQLKTPLDFYRMGRMQYNLGQFQLAVKCLEQYMAHSTRVEVAPLHLLAHAHRSLATQVWESAAATAAENNASAGEGTEKSAENMQRTHAKDSSNNDAAPTTNTAAKEEESEGGKQAEQRRLQEQSMDHLRRALECFVATVRLGFDDDWQLVVETRIDLEQKESTSTSTSSPTTVT